VSDFRDVFVVNTISFVVVLGYGKLVALLLPFHL